MRLSEFQIALIVLISLILGYTLSKVTTKEGFQNEVETVDAIPSICPNCNELCPQCQPMPDMTKYVLKTSVPPCQTCPEMTNYMLKTECPPSPDLSHFVLKSSIPKPEPIIIDNSACKNSNCGDCPPCPRPRCPEVKCPPPVSCPACPACPRQTCPEKVVKCKTEDVDTSPVRPYLTPLSISGFGAA